MCLILGLVLVGFALSAEPKLPVFTDITDTAGIRFKHSFGDYQMDNIVEAAGSGACVFDYNGDGLMDIYFVNGRWQKDVNDNRGRELKDKLFNALYRNNGDGTFTDVAEQTGVLGHGMGFGCSAADFDNDKAINFSDYVRFAAAWLTEANQPDFNAEKSYRELVDVCECGI